MKLGDTFGVNGPKLRGHILTYIGNYMNCYVFFDSVENSVLKVKKVEISRCMTMTTPHPKLESLKLFDFIENLPKDVFDVIYENTKQKISEAELVSLI